MSNTCSRNSADVFLLDTAALLEQSINGLSIKEDLGSAEEVKLFARWRGGLFSFDGVHPSRTAHALLANRLIDLMKTKAEERERLGKAAEFGGLHKDQLKRIPPDKFKEIFDKDHATRAVRAGEVR